jgi:Type VI secretion system VasI, EvfG, VC_A0118
MRSFFAVIAIVLVLMAAVASGRVQAQSMLEIAAEIKFCKKLTDDARRLKCFDGLFAEKQQPPATWSIEESKSPVDDSPQVTGMLYADDSTDPSSLMSPTVLVLRCKEKKTEAYLGKPFTLFGSNTAKVLVRINDGKPIETQWQPSSNGQGVFALAAIQFIRALPDNGKIFIRVTTFDGSTVDGTFTLGKVSEIRNKIAAHCHWPGTAATAH